MIDFVSPELRTDMWCWEAQDGEPPDWHLILALGDRPGPFAWSKDKRVTRYQGPITSEKWRRLCAAVGQTERTQG